jgi:asparagine synthase (glutamine-hydrolysing)
MASPSVRTSGAGSVIGDFVLACGVEATAWATRLDGFAALADPDEAVQAAGRGATRQGRADDGSRWVAVADLIDGRLDLGTEALGSGTPPQREWRGRFVEAAWHPNRRRVAALTDHFSTLPLYFIAREDLLLLATDLRFLAGSPFCRREIDLQSIYHYLNFAQIPAPRTIFREIRRLEPGTRLCWEPGAGARLDRYFLPEYPEDLIGDDDSLAAELRERIVATVEDHRPEGAHNWGCFLSGGTDSSSIVSILSRRKEPAGARVKTFSIGFAEQGYDELAYARLAAESCGADPSFAQVSRADTQALVTRVIEAYDQPLGNASAIPTLACTELAREHGVRTLVAGDGGDEIFGGNQRYAKDVAMEAWFQLPAPVRALGRAVGGAVGGGRVHLLNRVENFFERASLPNPDRFYTDDSFASDHYRELLSPDFRAVVERDASLDFIRGIYGLGETGGPLHRLMRLDLLLAIAQNDLRKVDGAARAAGVDVRFPYLDPSLIAYVNRLPERQKVRGFDKRFLFKRAMRSILPDQILRKRKQGFGLPISVWLRTAGGFQAAVRDTLLDARTTARGWWNRSFVERLFEEHQQGAWDHSCHLWLLYVLELWLRRYVDAT